VHHACTRHQSYRIISYIKQTNTSRHLYESKGSAAFGKRWPGNLTDSNEQVPPPSGCSLHKSCPGVCMHTHDRVDSDICLPCPPGEGGAVTPTHPSMRRAHTQTHTHLHKHAHTASSSRQQPSAAAARHSTQLSPSW